MVCEDGTEIEVVEKKSSVAFGWKTNFLFSFMGVLAGRAICAWPYEETLGVLIAAAYSFGTLVYALFAYPKLFTHEPWSRSAKTISFLNCLFGGLIFGSLWNRCLSRGKIGISNIIYSILMGLMLATLMLAALVATLSIGFEADDFVLRDCEQSEMLNRITEPGAVVDEFLWISDPVYTRAPPGVAFWQVFNEKACWALTEALGVSYDYSHEIGESLMASEWSLSLEGDEENTFRQLEGTIRDPQNGSVRGDACSGDNLHFAGIGRREGGRVPIQLLCDQTSSHATVYEHESFLGDGKKCVLQMVHVFYHEQGVEYPPGHFDRNDSECPETPWFIFISISSDEIVRS